MTDILPVISRERWTFQRNERWFEDTLPRLGEFHFMQAFGVSPATFRFLVESCRGLLAVAGRRAGSVRRRRVDWKTSSSSPSTDSVDEEKMSPPTSAAGRGERPWKSERRGRTLLAFPTLRLLDGLVRAGKASQGKKLFRPIHGIRATWWTG
ncbi:hypothetical protein HPB47_008570 [Ixodes persulcatus]|uniref:Uncharacterized protein n=1 Tax=Ixodes persulcatus TaxID=34615 RepID=A0AC60P4I5_IXOPE|nr:hypothetical protein HPB47_008570 [Ixodes persulcatus]